MSGSKMHILPSVGRRAAAFTRNSSFFSSVTAECSSSFSQSTRRTAAAVSSRLAESAADTAEFCT